MLLHAAAGGVGLIACQWLKHLGAIVIGTAGSPEKMALAKAHGATHVIDYRKEDVAKRVRELTGGKGVPVVYDGVGKDTFQASLDSLAPRGMFVSFGNASGPVPAFEPAILAAKGSLYFTRPSLMAYTATREDLLASAKALFDVVQTGVVKIEVNQTYPLKDAAQAHRDLEGAQDHGIDGAAAVARCLPGDRARAKLGLNLEPLWSHPGAGCSRRGVAVHGRYLHGPDRAGHGHGVHPREGPAEDPRGGPPRRRGDHRALDRVRAGGLSGGSPGGGHLHRRPRSWWSGPTIARSSWAAAAR